MEVCNATLQGAHRRNADGATAAPGRVAVAVSGGADSLALAWLMRGAGPLALIVDHGLRAASRDEALLTAARLAAFGVESRILTLTGLLPGPGLAARARVARYAALTGAARAAGLSDLLLGHHAGDQAETVLIRAAAGSGPSGLAGMASVVETTELRLVRPLLGVPPSRLRALLRSAGIDWVEDPSNRNPAAARTQARAALAGPDGAARCAALLSRAQACGTARRAAEADLARRLARRVHIFPQAYAVVSPGPAEPDLLAALIRGLTGAPYTERRAYLARLSAGPLTGTLGGIRFLPAGRHGPGTLLVREAAAMQGPVAAADRCVWDGRFRLETEAALPEGAQIGALGNDAASFRSRSGLASAILRTLPALRVDGRLCAVPHLGYFNGWTKTSLRLTFIPSAPVCGAPFEVFAANVSEQGDAQTAMAHHVRLDAAALAVKF